MKFRRADVALLKYAEVLKHVKNRNRRWQMDLKINE